MRKGVESAEAAAAAAAAAKAKRQWVNEFQMMTMESVLRQLIVISRSD